MVPPEVCRSVGWILMEESPRCSTLNGKASSCVPVAQFVFPFPCDPDQQRTEFPKDARQEVIQTDGSRIVSQETKL